MNRRGRSDGPTASLSIVLVVLVNGCWTRDIRLRYLMRRRLRAEKGMALTQVANCRRSQLKNLVMKYWSSGRPLSGTGYYLSARSSGDAPWALGGLPCQR